MTTAATARVAIVIPVFNGERFLSRTFDSALAQTFDAWRAVVVDDASTDGSLKLVQGYAERHPGRFTVIGLQANAGVVRARDRAIAAADGAELIVLLDHDDWLREDYLERMVGLYDAEQARGRHIGIVACDAVLHGAGGRDAGTWGQRTGWRDVIDLDGLIHQNLIFARALFRRDVYVQVGGFCADVAGSDDHDLWLRIVEAGWEVAVTREPLAHYRVHTGGLSRDRVRMLDNKLAVYERALARGALSASRRRAVRRRMRHYRAVRGRWVAQREWSQGRRLVAAAVGMRAAPLLVLAALQDPAWLLARRERRLPDPSATSVSAARTDRG